MPIRAHCRGGWHSVLGRPDVHRRAAGPPVLCGSVRLGDRAGRERSVGVLCGIKNGEAFIGGIPPVGPQPGVPSHWLLYFLASDCDGAAAKATSAGGSILWPTTMEGVGRRPGRRSARCHLRHLPAATALGCERGFVPRLRCLPQRLLVPGCVAQTPSAIFTTLYNFTGSPGDAANPGGPLVAGEGGVLYGTAGGGADNEGAVFELNPPASPGGAWSEAVLVSIRRSLW